MASGNYELDRFTNSSHSVIFSLVGDGAKVLDVGCANGFLAEKLKKEKQCEVWGIEVDPELANQAKAFCKEVFAGDVEDLDIHYPADYFDAIIFGDILEHTKDPKEVIIRYKKHLKKDGKMIVSLPNIAFWSIRLNLLFGRFDYQEKGIMDRTHLRFFTIRSARELIWDCGLKILEIRYAGRLMYYLRLFPTLFAYQSINVCVRKDD